MSGPGVTEVGDRIEALLADLNARPDPAVGEVAEELVRQLVTLYGDALERIRDLAGPDALRRAAADPLVAGLLVLHDLHPVPLAERVDAALEAVRPYLGSHAGGVTLLGIDADEGVVRVQLEGSCDGCGASAETVRGAIEQSIREHAPEILAVEAEGAAATGSLLQIGSGPPRAWTRVEGVRLLPGQAAAVDVEGTSLVICAVAGELYAYRDTCAACGTALGADSLATDRLRCTACGASFDVRAAGRSTEGDGLQLRPVPLLPDEGAIKVSVPVGVGV